MHIYFLLPSIYKNIKSFLTNELVVTTEHFRKKYSGKLHYVRVAKKKKIARYHSPSILHLFISSPIQRHIIIITGKKKCAYQQSNFKLHV
jgi:hypothetical protein